MSKNNQSCHTKGQCSGKCWLLGLAFIGVCCLTTVGVLCAKYCRSGVALSNLNEKAVKNIKSGLDIPDSFQLIRSEQPDSAFGVFWFTNEEQEAMSELAMECSVTMLDSVSELYGDSLSVNDEALAKIKVYGPVLQKAGMVMMEVKEKGAFSGWKVKTVYSFSDVKNHRFTLTRWTFFDPKGERILGKMELPGDVASKVADDDVE